MACCLFSTQAVTWTMNQGWHVNWYRIRNKLQWNLHRNSTYCGLVTPYGDRDMGQHWLRQWLVAWQHQAITWTNVDLSSVEICGIHLTTILLVALKVSIHEMSWKIIFLKLQPHLTGANELKIFIKEMLFKISSVKMVAILFGLQCVEW